MHIEHFESQINNHTKYSVTLHYNKQKWNQYQSMIMANIDCFVNSLYCRITISIINHVTKKQHQKDTSSRSSSRSSASQSKALKWIRSKIQEDLQLWSACRLWPLEWRQMAAVWRMKKGKQCCLHLSHCSRPTSDADGPLIQEDSSTTSCT